MMTEVVEIMVDEVTIVVTDGTVMEVDEIMVVEIEADRQDGIIVVMIVMMVEGIYHTILNWYNYESPSEFRNLARIVPC